MTNLSQGLIELGFTPRVDYIVIDDGRGNETVTWFSAQPQPDNATIVTAAVTAQAKQDAEDARVAGLLADSTRATMLQRLRSATPQQISDYVEAQVAGTTVQQVAAVKAILKGILLAIALDSRK